MSKIIKINGSDFKNLLKETMREVMSERNGNDSIKVFLTKEEMTFLEELLHNLDPENEIEDGVIRKLKTSLSDAQVNL